VDHSLVIAAAHAAGPCPPGEEPAWDRRGHALTVDLHLIAQQAAQDIARLDSSSRFVAFLEKVEIEESSRRGLLTFRNPAGDIEHSRTEQQETDRGWRPDRTGPCPAAPVGAGLPVQLMDLGDGAIAVPLAKKILLNDVGGAIPRAQAAWAQAGLPDTGSVTVGQLEEARAKLRSA
jgi:hypothetical protein